MSDLSEQCLPELRLYDCAYVYVNGVRACGRQSGAVGCQAVQFPFHGINYTQMCGRVTGYQIGRPEGISVSTHPIITMT